jgi:para-aminobenzoate synthetase component 1
MQDGKVETRPIKGTRPRSDTVRQDRLLAEELHKHPKDRAENLMIVDLLRNDLSKCCAAGSVRVPKLFEVESFANVHHLVSTVEGRLAAERDALDALCSCFPGGSVTGAPKLRAMQIIEQLEPDRRGVYCGTIGYVGFDGSMDSNIVIRTLVYGDGKVHCWAGGGIVADSNPEDEYRETLHKASAMLRLLRQYGGECSCEI